MTQYLTRVRLASIPERINLWLRFGTPLREHKQGFDRHFVYLPARAIFAYVRWHGSEYGTRDWWLGILRAIAPGERASTVLDVDPGAEVLLQVAGSARVKQVLTLIDSIEAQGIAPEVVSPDYWRTVNTHLIARDTLPAYSAEQHAAYQARTTLMT